MFLLVIADVVDKCDDDDGDLMQRDSCLASFYFKTSEFEFRI